MSKCVFVMRFSSHEPLGIQLCESRKECQDDASQVEVQVFVREISSERLSCGAMLRPGDVLVSVGSKGREARSWEWESVLGFSLEDAIAALCDARNQHGQLGLKFVRTGVKLSTLMTFGSKELEERPAVIKREEVPVSRRMGLTTSSSPSSKDDTGTSPTSVRLGSEFQCSVLPAATGEDTIDKTQVEMLCDVELRDEDEQVFNPRVLASGDLWRILQAMKASAKCENLMFDEEVALQALHKSGYDELSALDLYPQTLFYQQVLPWSERDKNAFEDAIHKVGCRDFHAITQEMGNTVSVASVVDWFYSHWKTSSQYGEWKVKVKDEIARGQAVTCEQCNQGSDPYKEAVYCTSCPTLCHLECFIGPVPRLCQTSKVRKDWKCFRCAHPFPLKRAAKLGPNGKVARALLGKPHNPAGRTTMIKPILQQLSAEIPVQQPELASLLDLPEKDSQGALDISDAAEDVGRKRPRVSLNLEGESEEYLDDDFDPKMLKKKKKPRGGVARGDVIDEQGRKLHFLKGVVIDPQNLYEQVQAFGGFETVVAQKRWQDIRKAMKLPHTTSSSTQLRDSYLSYWRNQEDR